MSDTGDSPGRGTGGLGWLWIALGVVVVLALGAWAFASFRPASETVPPSAASSTPTPSSTRPAAVTPSPQPTEFATPTPGATDPVEKPDETVEVPLDEPATAAGDVVVEVTDLEARTAGREVPGETSGPAIAVTVRITNNGDEAVNTSGSNVNLTYGGDERIPAAALSDPDATVWPASVAPGRNASAVFLFSVPEAASGDIRVIVDLLAAEPDVVFVGPEP